MAMFIACFDASGNHLDPAAIFVSGFVAEVGEWERFKTGWYALLKEHRLSNPFHMSEFMAARGPYSKWRDRQGVFLVPALQLIKNCVRKDVSQGLVVPDFDRLHREYDIPESHHLGSLLRSPLAYCGVSAVTQVQLWESRAKRKGIKIHGATEYVFDRGDKHRGELFSALLEVFDVKATPMDKAEFPAIQAADILAWAHRRAVAYDLAGKDVVPDAYAYIAKHFPGAKEWQYSKWAELSAYCDEEGLQRRVSRQ